MGKKRVTGLFEATYDPDDPRSLEELRQVTRNAMEIGLSGDGGFLAAYAVTSASTDPDPEPTPEDPGPSKDPNAPGQPDKVL